MRLFKIFLSIVLFAPAAYAQDTLSKYTESIVKRYVTSAPNSGLIIGIIFQGKTHVFSYGETEKGSGLRPDTNNLFEIGSISEVFTALLLADMQIKGEVNIDDPVQKYLPVNVATPVYQQVICKPVENEVFKSYPEENNPNRIKFTPYICLPDPLFKPTPIVLCYLATHTSGLPDLPSNIKARQKTNPFADYTKENLYAFMKTYSIDVPMGFDYRYSRLGMTLLGHALSLKAGKTYEELIIDHICSGLGMIDTRITLNTIQRSRFLNGHDKHAKITSHWDYDIMAPVGGLRSTMSDMLRFLSANTGTTNTLLKNTLDYTHNPRIIITGKKSKEVEIAFGWLVSPLNLGSKKIVWQSSTTGGFAAFIGFEEISKTGVVILSNSCKPVDKIGMDILRYLN
jgi:serine-type D-Ala-D-Ala carboxypeptidase/endopeptidase